MPAAYFCPSLDRASGLYYNGFNLKTEIKEAQGMDLGLTGKSVICDGGTVRAL